MAAHYDALLPALEAFSAFVRQNGATKEATKLEELLERLRREGRSSKAVEEAIFKQRGLASVAVLPGLSKRDPSEGDRLTAEFSTLRKALDLALFPPDPNAVPKTKIRGLAGNDEETNVYGDPAQAQTIAHHTLEVINRFCDAVFQSDWDAAYALCSAGLRAAQTLPRVHAELEKADQTFGGRAVAHEIEYMNQLLADEDARLRSSKKEGEWPGHAPKPTWRASVVTFWFTDRQTRAGRWAMFWVVEEDRGYRIAKWTQYVQ